MRSNRPNNSLLVILIRAAVHVTHMMPCTAAPFFILLIYSLFFSLSCQELLQAVTAWHLVILVAIACEKILQSICSIELQSGQVHRS